MEDLDQPLRGPHTPGPWEMSNDAVPSGHVQVTVYAESTGERVATAFGRVPNARLIAAAPDLLVTLQNIADGTLSESRLAIAHLRRSREAARTAIAKALGE